MGECCDGGEYIFYVLEQMWISRGKRVDCTEFTSISPKFMVIWSWDYTFILKDSIKLRKGNIGLPWALNPMTGFLTKAMWKTETQTEEMSCDDREWDDKSTIKRALKIANNYQKQKEAMKDTLWEPGEYDMLTPWFQTCILQTCGEDKFLLLKVTKFMVIYYSSTWKLNSHRKLSKNSVIARKGKLLIYRKIWTNLKYIMWVKDANA